MCVCVFVSAKQEGALLVGTEPQVKGCWSCSLDLIIPSISLSDPRREEEWGSSWPGDGQREKKYDY